VFKRITQVILALPLALTPHPSSSSADLSGQRVTPFFVDSLQKSIDSSRQALRSAASSTDSCLDAAVVFQDAGLIGDSIQALEQCAKAAPEDARVFSALGLALYNTGRLSEAKVFLAKAVSLDSPDPFNALGLGRIALEENAPTEAEAYFDQVIEARPRLALGYYYRAQSRAAQKKPEEAIADYQAAIKLDSFMTEARLPLAALFEETGEWAEAWKQYTRALNMDPANREADRRRAAILDRLTENPKKILSPRAVEKPTAVEPAADGVVIPELKVGLGASPNGKPGDARAVHFRASAPFQLKNASTGKILAEGAANEEWTLRIDLGARPTRVNIFGPGNKRAGSFRGAAFVRMENPSRNTVILNTLHFPLGKAWVGMADKEVRGKLEVILSPSGRNLRLINHVNVEEYLYGVTAAEMPVHWPLEGLKSQAVIARTFALYLKQMLRPHRKFGYDLCDTDHCQVYTGVAVESPKARKAVDETRGRYLTYNGRPAHTVFASNCGGHSLSGREVGWGDVAYWTSGFDGPKDMQQPVSPAELRTWLKSEPPIYCNAPNYVWAPEIRWARLLPAAEFERRVRRRKDIGRLVSVTPLRRGRSGHVTSVRIRGSKGDLLITKEHQIRRLLGVGALRSALFVVETTYRDGKPAVFTLYGGGWGHGVGLCQSGAAGRAEVGFSYNEILAHYFQGTRLDRLSYAS